MRLISAAVRSIAALAIVLAVVATFLETAYREEVNPFNFFGFFTIQGNLFAAVVFIVSAAVSFSGRGQPRALAIARGCAVTYLFVIGLIYNTILVGLSGGVPMAWANVVLHVIIPLYALVDWTVFTDRAPLPWERAPIALIYPGVWLVVCLIRGHTDGWVPYPFLNPNLGYGVVALHSVGIAVAFATATAMVWALSRIGLPSRAAVKEADAFENT